MRLQRDCQNCYGCCALRSYPPATQHSLVTHAQQLWNEWEIQFLVLLSMSLQVFLLFAAVFRKRCSSRVLSVALWLAYLSADSVAVFVLGRLTLLVGDDPRQQLVLFWAPFLLLHLGGQETITAFSMEDCALWKRHLLNLTTQVTLAVYVVGKQWRGDKALVAPTTLIFVSGTVKYAERIWALKRAGTWSPSSLDDSNFLESGDSRSRRAEMVFDDRSRPYYEKLRSIISDGQEKNMERVIEVATEGFELCMDFLIDMAPPRPSLRYSLGQWYLTPAGAARSSLGSDSDVSRVDMVYKLAEIHLSLIYDYLYTKFGALMGVFYRLTTLALTSTALVLFAWARVGRLAIRYIEADVAISYVLLVGAVTLEMSSVFVWLLSSYSPYMTISSLLGDVPIHVESYRFRRPPPMQPKGLRCAGRVLRGIVKRLPDQSRVEWSRRMQRYNIVDGCIQEKRAGCLEKALRYVGVERDCTPPVAVSAEVKKLVFDKMYHVRTTSRSAAELYLTSFYGQWVQRWVLEVQTRRFENTTQDQHEIATETADPFEAGDAAQRALQISNIQGLDSAPNFPDFASNVFLWHLVTDMCLLADSENTADGSGFRSSSRDLSNYVMHLIIKSRAILGRDGRTGLFYNRQEMLQFVYDNGNDYVDRRNFIQKLQSIEIAGKPSTIFGQAHSVSLELLKIEAAAYRWELIATVWVEMLCYVAHHYEPGFHAKQLSAGGEFVSHVKVLLFILGFP